MKKVIIFILIFISTFTLHAQEMLGIIGSNYAGVNGLSMNPSSMADSKLYLDINVLATNIFYQTDMNKNAFANFRLNGPSVMVNNGNHAFAFVNAARTAISYKSITSNNGLNNEYKVAGLAWGEVGLSYAFIFSRIEKSVWSAGATAKMLFGAGGAYYASNTSGSTFNNDPYNNIQNSGMLGGGGMGYGKGIGFDIGVTYQKKVTKESLLPFKKLCQQKFYDYRYKIGVSIIDIGVLRFTKNVSSTNFYDNFAGHDTINNQNDTTLQNYSSSLNKDKFSVALPTAFCIQFDFHPATKSKNWYFHGAFVQSLELANYSIRRPTMISVAPRYEKRLYEASLPISISDFKYFRLGLALRFWKITVGTDNLLGSVGVGANKGFDFYTTIKIDFLKGKCRKKKMAK